MNNKNSSPLKNPGVPWLRFGLPLLAMLLWGSAQAVCVGNNRDIDLTYPSCTPQPECKPSGLTGDDAYYNFTRGSQIPAQDNPIGVNATTNVYWGLGGNIINGNNDTLSTTPQFTCPGSNGSGSSCMSGSSSMNGTCKIYACNNGITVQIPDGLSTSTSKVNISGTPLSFAGMMYFTLEPKEATDAKRHCPRQYVFYSNGGGGWGDPHITTVNGVNYDFQAAGEFTFLRGDELEIQARQTPISSDPPPNLPAQYTGYTGINSCLSIYTGVAAKVGSHRVIYRQDTIGNPDSNGMQLRVDGELIKSLPPEGLCLGFDSDSESAYRYSCGHITKTASGDGIEIDFPNKTKLVVTSTWWNDHKKWYLNLNVTNTAATEGIMGLTADSWLPRLPDGSSVGSKPASLNERYAQLYQTFGNAWRVTKMTQGNQVNPDYLFDDEQQLPPEAADWPRKNPTSCLIAGQPTAHPAAQGQTPAQVIADAAETCKEITDPARKANCEFDVAATGNTGFAGSYLASQNLEPGRTQTTVKDDKNPSKYEESVVFTATVAAAVNRPGVGIPAGSVQFILDTSNMGKPMALEASGLAAWTAKGLSPGTHRIQARYIPAPGSTFKASTSPVQSHTVTATPEQWFWYIVAAIVGLIAFLIRWLRQKETAK